MEQSELLLSHHFALYWSPLRAVRSVRLNGGSLRCLSNNSTHSVNGMTKRYFFIKRWPEMIETGRFSKSEYRKEAISFNDFTTKNHEFLSSFKRANLEGCYTCRSFNWNRKRFSSFQCIFLELYRFSPRFLRTAPRTPWPASVAGHGSWLYPRFSPFSTAEGH